MDLRMYFISVVYKVLSNVDLEKGTSNQHEVDGIVSLRRFFNTEELIQGEIQWHYFSDETDPIGQAGNFTFYDARKKSFVRTHRSEWRMYYDGNFINNCKVGDVLFLVKTITGNIHGLLFDQNSTWLRIALNLFNISTPTTSLSIIADQELSTIDASFYKRRIIEELGIDISLPVAKNDEDTAIELLENARKLDLAFPTTKKMSETAQSLCPSDFQDPDRTIITWLDKEEKIFRAIEKILVEERLKSGFSSVNDFISYSLSVQNRRKSRMGFSFQNHLSKIFVLNKIRFSPQAKTEKNNTPDFIFPGEKEYHDPEFSTVLLSMLAAKSSCKERWAQILTEAEKIPVKHLCTLDPAISGDQIIKMTENRIILVIPDQISVLYPDDQKSKFLSLHQFIEYVRDKQRMVQ